MKIYHTYVAKHMWKEAGSNDDPCFLPSLQSTPLLNHAPHIPVASMENEWVLFIFS